MPVLHHPERLEGEVLSLFYTPGRLEGEVLSLFYTRKRHPGGYTPLFNTQKRHPGGYMPPYTLVGVSLGGISWYIHPRYAPSMYTSSGAHPVQSDMYTGWVARCALLAGGSTGLGLP